MRQFDPNLSLEDNYPNGWDVEFAAWQFSGEAHREQYRNSGHSPPRSAWLRVERTRELAEACATGELLALGMGIGKSTLEICRIPKNLFLAIDLKIDDEKSQISGLGREYGSVRVFRSTPEIQRENENLIKTGRPNHLGLIIEAWNVLKSENKDFLDWDKSTQNREIREMSARLHPNKFPGKSRIGDSTIRKHRREHPELFC